MAKKRVIWTATALQDLEAIYDFIGEDAPLAAQNQIDKILDRESQLMNYPESGQIQPLKNIKKEYRYLVEGNYKIVYHIWKEIIYVDTVFDTRQDPDDLKL